jgi:hypothetical protein
MEPRRVSAIRGWTWIAQAYRLFRRAPLTWLVLNTLLLFIGSALMLFPLVGPLVFALLTPVFMAGLMLGCRDVERGGQLEIAHLFRGFRHNGAQLVTVGGVYLVGQVLVAGVMLSLGGEQLESALQSAMQGSGQHAEPAPVPDRLPLVLLAGSALFVPLAMAVWFAPPLVVLDGLAAFAAMKASMRGCLRNLLPMVVYGAGLVGLLTAALFVLRAVLAVVPPAIGFVRGMSAVAVFLAWVTLTLISVYTSYRDVFPADAEASTDPSTAENKN